MRERSARSLASGTELVARRHRRRRSFATASPVLWSRTVVTYVPGRVSAELGAVPAGGGRLQRARRRREPIGASDRRRESAEGLSPPVVVDDVGGHRELAARTRRSPPAHARVGLPPSEVAPELPEEPRGARPAEPRPPPAALVVAREGADATEPGVPGREHGVCVWPREQDRRAGLRQRHDVPAEGRLRLELEAARGWAGGDEPTLTRKGSSWSALRVARIVSCVKTSGSRAASSTR